jgi:hypothetical protein
MRTELRVSRVLLAISVLTLSGCLVGAERVSAPPRLPSEELRPLTRPITFDVCVSPNIQPPYSFEGDRRVWGEKFRDALSRAGVSAELRSTAESPVDFTIARRLDLDGEWSMFLSMFTLSVVPGYSVQRTTLDVDFAWVDAAQVPKNEHLQYRSRKALFMWLPLIVYPDVVGGIGGGWESSKSKDGGFDQMVGRFGDDIRARLGRAGKTPSTARGGAVACPKLPSSGFLQ